MKVFPMSFQAHLLNAYHAAYPIQCCMLVTYSRFLLDPELCLYSIYPIGPIDMFMPVTQQTQFLHPKENLDNVQYKYDATKHVLHEVLTNSNPWKQSPFLISIFANMISILPLCCWKLAVAKGRS